MNLYRTAFEIPKTAEIKRNTFVADPWNALVIAEMLAKMAGNAYLLSIVEIRAANVPGDLELVP